MKLSFSAFVISSLVATASVRAACREGNACQQGDGECTRAIELVGSNANGNAALNVAKYGNYCGSGNVCIGPYFGGEGAATEPCDEIDAACFFHDRCLALNAFPGKLEGIQLPKDCACEVGLIASLASASQNIGTTPTGLCDTDFYNEDGSIKLGVDNEAVPIIGQTCLGFGLEGFTTCVPAALTTDEIANFDEDLADLSVNYEAAYATADAVCSSLST